MTIVDLDAPRFKLGLIHDPLPPEVPELQYFEEAPVPAPPASVALIPANRPMALNDQIGDCTIAGAEHLNQQGALILDQPWTYPGDEVTNQTFTSLGGTPTTGLTLPTVLKPWHLKGLFGEPPNGGYALVRPKNTKQVEQSIWIFGANYVAVDLPAIAQQQFKPDGSGVWELTHTSADYQIEGGHCIVGVAYTAEGVICVTWGSTVLVTWEWWFTYVVQVYAVVPPAFVANGGDGRGYNLAAIDAYLPRV